MLARVLTHCIRLRPYVEEVGRDGLCSGGEEMEETQIVLRTKLIDPQGVAAEYGIPVTTQRDLRRRGEFVPVMKIGHRWYYRREALEAWLDAQIGTPSPKALAPLPQHNEAEGSNGF
jgi:Helix-turn-helix domain